METMGWEQKWAKIGVKAVIAPHAAADNSITFSPPTLNKSTSIYEYHIQSKQVIAFEYTSEHFSSKPDIPQGSQTLKTS